MTNPRPAEYADGYGELIRAHRVYLGISQRTMADRIGMGERSLSDIEVGRRKCPPGFLDTVVRLVQEFDSEVDAMVCSAKGLAKNPASSPFIEVKVSDSPRNEWRRAVVGRAAVESEGLIIPELAGAAQRTAV